MYDSVILRTISRIMLPILLLLSLFMLVRGHNLPGGGFIGGLVGASAIILQIVAFGPGFARRVMPTNFLMMSGLGVVVAAISGLPALWLNLPFMEAFWMDDPVPGLGKLGTPLLFDIGVFITVIGVTTQLAFMLAEEPLLYPIQRKPAERSPTDAEVAPEA
jgi:multicomponent Na+:H+ antiporter subunit B